MKRYLICISMIAVIFSFSSVLQAQPNQKTWNDVAREYVKQHPENKGLSHLMTALDGLDMNAVLPHQEAINNIYKDGWTKPYPEINQLIQSQSRSLKAAVEAADLYPFDLPPIEAVDSPVPNFLTTQLIAKLLAVESRRLEAAGNLHTAAQRAVQGAKFGAIFCDEQAQLISHLIGIASIDISLRPLESILRKPKLSKDTAQAVGAELYKIDQEHKSLINALRHDHEILINFLFNSMNELGEKERKNLGEKEKKFIDSQKEYSRVYNILLKEYSKPYWELSPEFKKGNLKKLTNDVTVQKTIPNFTEAITRETTMLARLRICQAMCAKKMGQPDLAASIIDPFTGKPLMKMENSFYCLGPDMTDQGGKVVYDPTNGTQSAGDVVER